MINSKLPFIYYGGDYNPDQWPEDVWAEDMRLFKAAGVNLVTLPVFGWAKLQPEEDRFDFEWLDRILDLVVANGIRVCLATATAAQPAWLSRKYPEVLPVDIDGRRHTHGNRNNFCPNSRIYREFSAGLARRMAERYHHHPALALWHIGNEYGTHCYCENCAREFRVWAQKRYGTLEELNRRWYLSFWGHTVYDWEEIVLPSNLNGDNRCFQGITLDYRRFMSESLLECYQKEYDAVKAVAPEIPATTNFWGVFNGLDLHRWAQRTDVVAWDSYPALNEPVCNVAMRHDLMRGLKHGRSFMLMEQTPSQQNWQPYNSLKRPGVMRLWSYQALARGAEAVLFFQLRRSFGACEKTHGALIAHSGHENTRVFRECAQLGKELERLGECLLDAETRNEVAILYDTDTWNAVELSSGPSVDLSYPDQLYRYYQAFYELNIGVDILNPAADLSGYKIVVAPLLYMLKPGIAAKLEEFVAGGGTFVTTFCSGWVDENDRVILGGYPGELRGLLGIWVEEVDALPPELKNSLIMTEPLGKLSGKYECGMLCDVLHLEGAQALAVYGKDFYAGMPGLTVNRFGAGTAYYIASHPEPRFIGGFVQYLCERQQLCAPLQTAAGVEITRRWKGDTVYTFVLNHNDTAIEIDLGIECYREMIAGTKKQGKTSLPPREVWILTQPFI